ncbi:MAG TPA: peptidoglycan recognition family protein [Polyangia bacterium]|nr:peptidoglycan recognition family protein [Polyangia bacterium]
MQPARVVAAAGLLIVACQPAPGGPGGAGAGGKTDGVGPDDEGVGAIRRICLQNGIAGIGGGSIVRLQHDDGQGSLTIETLIRVRATIPAQSDAGRSTLCEVPAGPMRVCPEDATHTGDVPVIEVLSDMRGGAGVPVGVVARGSDIMLWDFVHDGAGHGKAVALVGIDGQQRFIPAGEVCFAQTYSIPSDVTTLLHMKTEWASTDPMTGTTTVLPSAAAPNTYRPRSPDTIARIVVHNTEEPFANTLSDFTSGRNGTSAHVVIDRDGTMYRVVEDQFAAYHAGGSADGMGNYNTTTLGVEVVAYDGSMFGGQAGDANFMTDQQRTSLTSLINAWMYQYGLWLRDDIVHDTSSAPGYADLEYASAALTIHRLTKANRGTDCPRFLWDNSADGDEAFFRWREQSFAGFGP